MNEGFDKDRIKEIMSQVDELFLDQKINKKRNPVLRGQLKIGGGMLLFLVGFLISINSFIDESYSSYYILGGPIIGGMSLYYSGKRDLRKAGKSAEKFNKNFFNRKWN